MFKWRRNPIVGVRGTSGIGRPKGISGIKETNAFDDRVSVENFLRFVGLATVTPLSK